MELGNCRWLAFSVYKLVPEALVEGLAVERDAVALPVELVCVGIGRSLAFLGHFLHLEPVAKVSRSDCRCRPQVSSIDWTVVSGLILVKQIHV